MCIVNFELRFEKSYLWFESILLVVNCDMWAYILWFEYMVFDLWLVNLRLVEFYPWIYNFPKNQESDFSFLSNSNSGNPRKDGDNIEDLLASIFGTNLAKQFFGNYHFFDFFWTDDTILWVNQVNQLCHYNKWWIWKSKKQFGGKFLLTSLRRRPADSNSWIWHACFATLSHWVQLWYLFYWKGRVITSNKKQIKTKTNILSLIFSSLMVIYFFRIWISSEGGGEAQGELLCAQV